MREKILLNDLQKNPIRKKKINVNIIINITI